MRSKSFVQIIVSYWSRIESFYSLNPLMISNSDIFTMFFVSEWFKKEREIKKKFIFNNTKNNFTEKQVFEMESNFSLILYQLFLYFVDLATRKTDFEIYWSVGSWKYRVLAQVLQSVVFGLSLFSLAREKLGELFLEVIESLLVVLNLVVDRIFVFLERTEKILLQAIQLVSQSIENRDHLVLLIFDYIRDFIIA